MGHWVLITSAVTLFFILPSLILNLALKPLLEELRSIHKAVGYQLTELRRESEGAHDRLLEHIARDKTIANQMNELRGELARRHSEGVRRAYYDKHGVDPAQ